MRIACLLMAFACAFANAAEVTHVSNVDELKHAIRGGGAGAKIELAAGIFFLDEPLILTPAKSGLTIEAAAGASTVISGGKRIEGWHAAKFNGRDCWAAEVADVKAGKWFFRELWVDGRRAVRARTPNRGSIFMSKNRRMRAANGKWVSGGLGLRGMTFRRGRLRLGRRRW